MAILKSMATHVTKDSFSFHCIFVRLSYTISILCSTQGLLRPTVTNESEKGIQIIEGAIWCQWNRSQEQREINSHGSDLNRMMQERFSRMDQDLSSGNLKTRIEREYLEPGKKIIKPLGSRMELRSCIDSNSDLTIHFSITGRET